MAVISRSSPFGSVARTRVLLALHLLSESYARELSRLIGMSLAGVQDALRSLERDGLVAARTVGRSRVYQIEPRYFAKTDLEKFLARLIEGEPELRATIASSRRRPRRTGKPA